MGKTVLEFTESSQLLSSSWEMNPDCRKYLDMLKISSNKQTNKQAASSVVFLTLRDCCFEVGGISWNVFILLSKRWNVHFVFSILFTTLCI